jgi:hypothetical protein
LYHQLATKYEAYHFGLVNIDEKPGMKLATSTGAIQDGVPSVRAYKKRGDRAGMLVWAGEMTPTFEELESAFLKAVTPLTAFQEL